MNLWTCIVSHARQANRRPGIVVAGFSAAAILLGLFAVPTLARAQATVGCPGAPAGNYTYNSLTAAVNAGIPPNTTLTIVGTCTEAVTISDVQNLTIVGGSSGATLVDPGDSAPAYPSVLEIDNSQGVQVFSLTIQLAARPASNEIPGIGINASQVLVAGVHIAGASGSDGIDVNGPSSLTLRGANLIENNNDGQGNGEGILMGQGASVAIANQGGKPLFQGCTVIQGNGDDGVVVALSSSFVVHLLACATIQDNANAGIETEGTSTSRIGSANPGTTQLLNNRVGAIAEGGSRLEIVGPVSIEGNSFAGVQLQHDSSAAMLSNGTTGGPDGPVIQQNATAQPGLCCSLPAGITVATGSTIDLDAGTVSGNSGPGVVLQDNASANIIGPFAITQNPVGVSVINDSTAALSAAPSISGNSTTDIYCGTYSLAYGDASAVGHMICTAFTAQPSAAPPRSHLHIVRQYK